MEPCFTVITVTYNAGESIRKTIESVLNQVHKPYEYLIIDGLSKDETVSISREYEECFFERGIRYTICSEKDTGIYNAMNKGIQRATGDFISFLNAGDWYEIDALKNIFELYSEAEFDLTYGSLHYIGKNGAVINKMSKMDHVLITSRHWNHPSMFLRRELYLKHGFDESYPTYSDFDLYLALRKDKKIVIRVIDKVITNFVADGVSTNAKLSQVLSRGKEKYRAYRGNGYSRLYWLEAFGWELLKAAYMKLRT